MSGRHFAIEAPFGYPHLAVDALKKDANELWLSPISTWEALTLNFKGRIRIRGSLEDWMAEATVGTQEAPFTHEIALLARQLPLHQDPADPV